MAHVHDTSRPGAHRRLAATLAVTITIMVAEVAGGLISGSLALLADAGHMLTDALALLIAFVALLLAARPADDRRTYGYRRLEILAALINGVALVVVSGSILIEAVERWMMPREVDARVMSGVAVVGLVANLVGLGLLGGHRGNLNVRAAFLHVLTDTLSSVGVLAGAIAIALTGWTRADALISAAIAVAIAAGSFTLLREVVEVLLEAAPRGIDTERVRQTIGDINGVDGVHDLHVWSITSGMPALSAHVTVKDPAFDPHEVLMAIRSRLRELYSIDHSTLQIERNDEGDCSGC
jgi:cobalt-zinc-cadmium efflux system protein